MRFLIDEDVDVRVIAWLVNEAHDAVRVPLHAKNGELLGLAVRDLRILITRDKDFTNRLQYPPSRYHGIIALRIHPPLLEKLVGALRRLLSSVSEIEIIGKLVVVEETGYHLLV